MRQESQSTVASPEIRRSLLRGNRYYRFPTQTTTFFRSPDPIPDVDVDALIEAAYDNIHFAIEQIHLFHNFLHYFVTFIS